jgi:hypothetical protein
VCHSIHCSWFPSPLLSSWSRYTANRSMQVSVSTKRFHIMQDIRQRRHIPVCCATVFCTAGQLWELDGRRKGPISHGPTQQDTLLLDVARVAKEFIARCVGLKGGGPGR